MATNYSYNFNCVIKYRFNGEDDNKPEFRFNDSTQLVTINSTESDIMKLKLPLPNYIRGVEDEIEWFLDSDYQINIKSISESLGLVGENTDPTTANPWKITNQKTIGTTYTACTATLILYSNTIENEFTWKYKDYSVSDTNEITITDTEITTKCWGTTDPLNSAPKIPKVLKTESGGKVTFYTFKSWSLEENTTKYTATYDKATYDSNNPFMTTQAPIGDGEKLVNIFSDAEPYHYGTGTPGAGYFMPIGEDNDDATLNDVKVQAPENNGYSILKSIDGYKIKGKPIQYIEKGTFPLPKLLKSHSTINFDHGFCKVYALYDSNEKLEKLCLYYATNSNTTTDPEVTDKLIPVNWSETYTLYDKTQDSAVINIPLHGTEEVPKRLGFVLCGGGGGAGGSSRIDPKEDGKSEGNYSTPGGGGGGAEIVYGTLDISKPLVGPLTGIDGVKRYSSTFYIYIGVGGTGGTIGSESGVSFDSPNYGGNGGNGYDSRLWVVNENQAEELLLCACGGFGGTKGGKEASGSAGAGGKNGFTCDGLKQNKSYKRCTISGRIAGGNGAPYGSSYTNQSFSYNIYFGTVTPPEDDDFCLMDSFDANPGNTSHASNNASITMPGGHSLGAGGTKDTIPDYGGGGCSSSTANVSTGGAGFFGLYY